MDCNLLGFSIHGILQARILEWIAISFSRGSSWPRAQTRVSCIGGRRFNLWATRVSPEIPAKNMDWVVEENSRQGLEDQFTPCLIVSAWPSKHLFTKRLLFYLHVNCLLPLWSPKPLPPTSSFGFSWRWYIRWGLLLFWWVTQFSWVSLIYNTIKLGSIFSC